MSIHNAARLRHLARARLRHLARPEVPVQVRARRLREHEVVRGVAGAHPLFWTRSSTICGAQVCSRGRQASLVTATTQDILVMTHPLFRVCVVVLSSVTSRSVAAAAASSLMRFFPSPSCRGDAANPWLESAFISHVGCVSHHPFVCFPQSLVIALCSTAAQLQGSFVTVKTHASSRVSGHRARVNLVTKSRHCFVFGWFFASGTARARSFCTHQRSRITESTSF